METPKIPDISNIKDPYIAAAIIVHAYTTELEKKLKLLVSICDLSFLAYSVTDNTGIKPQVLRSSQIEPIKVLIGLIEENIKTTENILKLAEIKEI
jgi:hypothetical protein